MGKFAKTQRAGEKVDAKKTIGIETSRFNGGQKR